MTHMQIKLPEKLTAKDLDGISYVFSKMSLASKHAFIASLIVAHPEHYTKVAKAIGDDYYDCMVYA